MSEVVTAAMISSNNTRERQVQEERARVGLGHTQILGDLGERGQFQSMALAIQDTGKAEYQVHNVKTFHFLVNIQKGESIEERIKSASKVIGNFSVRE